jgi:hypothetical protein
MGNAGRCGGEIGAAAESGTGGNAEGVVIGFNGVARVAFGAAGVESEGVECAALACGGEPGVGNANGSGTT